jgi:hypothetical protein
MTTQTQMQNEIGMTAKEASNYSRLVAEDWAETNADLLTCFNADGVNNGLYGFFATTHHAAQPIHYGELSLGFLRLLDSKVLVPEFPIQGVAAEQLQDMRARFSPTSNPTSTPSSAATTDPNDFSKMSLADFNALATTDARRLYKSNASFRKRADFFWGGGR